VSHVSRLITEAPATLRCAISQCQAVNILDTSTLALAPIARPVLVRGRNFMQNNPAAECLAGTNEHTTYSHIGYLRSVGA
jgi:hypothetical protein